MPVEAVHVMIIRVAVLAGERVLGKDVRMIALYVIGQQRILLISPVFAMGAAEAGLLSAQVLHVIAQRTKGLVVLAALLAGEGDTVVALVDVEDVLAQRVGVLGLEVAVGTGYRGQIDAALVALMPAQVFRQLEGLAALWAGYEVLRVIVRVDALVVIDESLLTRALVLAQRALEGLRLAAVVLQVHRYVVVVLVALRALDALELQQFLALGAVGHLLAEVLLVGTVAACAG